MLHVQLYSQANWKNKNKNVTPPTYSFKVVIYSLLVICRVANYFQL